MKLQDLSNKVISGNRRALAKAITLIESTLDSDRTEAHTLMKEILPHAGKALRIGISGIPGVGKSSFIEVLGLELIKKGHKVAVLAVDPSSPISGGSILGDKTRMEELSQNDSAFIRPSPTTGSLGGVAAKTRESIYLCEANGYDIVLIETVGVGQSEYEVASMVDLFMVLMVPNAGDELQGIKKGIIELSDMLIINKADGDTLVLAENARTQYQNALHIIKKDKFWSPLVLTCSSLQKTGLPKIIDSIFDFQNESKKSGFFEDNRKRQIQRWLKSLFQSELDHYIKNDLELKKKLTSSETKVVNGEISASQGAKEMLNYLLNH
ncbi:MAG: methylmalonyl Co-A mutase-associated GTPase MeaB [Halobacteriovoraceae bacterium]|nr:methylmalonyl Co-A mutase-associated GTPase MeaB [Halobacteriovoraceae bacterium]MBC98461.1 methylmalonyl Co-A mutase-associated GTPase MeaB [Halobacteriovoraceae bacterium]|tara:strand:- start:3389 stop:4360 length:972 start_codon:yes stop_codon:yes gene_type:complete